MLIGSAGSLLKGAPFIASSTKVCASDIYSNKGRMTTVKVLQNRSFFDKNYNIKS